MQFLFFAKTVMTLQDLSLKTAQVGKLFCQRNSMAKFLRTRVVSCVIDEKASAGDAKQFEVLLEDTIIFPTGGGQPSDRGFIKTLDGAEVNVLCCDRKGLSAIHYVDAPLIPDTEVEVHIDWKNRFDHMQQHSGQHIVSDIAEHLYKWTTFCWNMGKGID
jgi:misacylated tRNA(Ala) deacylase